MDGVEAGSIPTASQGFDEEDGSDQTLTLDYGYLLLVGQEILLRAHNIEIADKAADIPGVGEVELAARSSNGIGLRLTR